MNQRRKVTLERLREVLDYDRESGVFSWRVPLGSRARVGPVRSMPSAVDGYIRIQIDKEQYLAHRLAWMYCHGRWPEYGIDHIDGNALNNSIANLRDLPQALNTQNRTRPRSDSKHGFQGVGVQPNGTFQARLHVGGKRYNLGTFERPEDAHEAYLKAKAKLHVGWSGKTIGKAHFSMGINT